MWATIRGYSKSGCSASQKSPASEHVFRVETYFDRGFLNRWALQCVEDLAGKALGQDQTKMFWCVVHLDIFWHHCVCRSMCVCACACVCRLCTCHDACVVLLFIQVGMKSRPNLRFQKIDRRVAHLCRVDLVISQTISLVSQKRLSSEAGISLFIGFNHTIWWVVLII